MDENKKDCPCEAVRQLAQIVDCHDRQLEEHEERLDAHDKRLARGNTDFAVICAKLNIIMGVLAAVGVAIVGAVVSQIW